MAEAGGDFHAGYVTALRTYLETRGEEELAVGHELGRRALQEGMNCRSKNERQNH